MELPPPKHCSNFKHPSYEVVLRVGAVQAGDGKGIFSELLALFRCFGLGLLRWNCLVYSAAQGHKTSASEREREREREPTPKQSKAERERERGRDGLKVNTPRRRSPNRQPPPLPQPPLKGTLRTLVDPFKETLRTLVDPFKGTPLGTCEVFQVGRLIGSTLGVEVPRPGVSGCCTVGKADIHGLGFRGLGVWGLGIYTRNPEHPNKLRKGLPGPSAGLGGFQLRCPSRLPLNYRTKVMEPFCPSFGIQGPRASDFWIAGTFSWPSEFGM